MKRLVRKAGQLELYHGTSFDSFIKICKTDSLEPFSVTNNKGGMGSSGYGGDVSFINGIYLTDDEDLATNQYAEPYIDGTNSMAVVIKVSVDSDRLLPDLDRPDLISDYFDGEELSEEELKNLTYKDTLEYINQCIYEGSIPVNQIFGVKFIGSGNEKFKFDQWVSYEYAKSLVQ